MLGLVLGARGEGLGVKSKKGEHGDCPCCFAWNQGNRGTVPVFARFNIKHTRTVPVCALKDIYSLLEALSSFLSNENC